MPAGIRRMRDTARDQGCPEPAFSENSFFTAVFFPDPEVRAQFAEEAATPEVTPEVDPEIILLKALTGALDRRALQAALGSRTRSTSASRICSQLSKQA